jgi:hypothetical protein
VHQVSLNAAPVHLGIFVHALVLLNLFPVPQEPFPPYSLQFVVALPASAVVVVEAVVEAKAEVEAVVEAPCKLAQGAPVHQLLQGIIFLEREISRTH